MTWTLSVSTNLSYSEMKKERARKQGHIKEQKDCWWIKEEDHKWLFCFVLPQGNQWKIIKGINDSYHLGREALATLISCALAGEKLEITIQEVKSAWYLQLQSNQRGKAKPLPLLNSVQK